MGWSSGSSLMDDIIEAIKNAGIDFEKRVEIYTSLIESFESYDADTLDECLNNDKAFDKAYMDLYPELFEEEYEFDIGDDDE